ncbi:transglutaminase family protein [Pseudanabaena sp. PCC 6802]|uniref:transglutaminase family protein n=1 Tax=Pseudanabaena sp. PCC 6802 TaxID=118173 RepID=UPI00034D8B40|nr:transglutaminase family protein [Pseudanabaena sp. PCC 6802]
MRYKIFHATTYSYAQTVSLLPHMLRLRPRCDIMQKLLHFQLDIDPEPANLSQIVDLDGNAIAQIWFEQPTQYLTVQASSEVETYCDNPFNYLLEPWATRLPIDYPASYLTQLQPYLNSGQAYGQSIGQSICDPIATQLAQELRHDSQDWVVTFLGNLNQRLYEECRYVIREEGAPMPAGLTWSRKEGSCRDLTVLFMEVCRAVGIPARFVSGYQEGDLDSTERHLHAWAEIYLPGAGWRGYDPTHGLAVSDRHIAIAASALPIYTAPITGKLKSGNVSSSIEFSLSIQKIFE